MLEDEQFERALVEVEQSLQALRARYLQVRQDQQQQAQLQAHRAEIERQLQRNQSEGRSSLKADLQQLQIQLDELEVALESRLFTWDSFKERFWQVVRFGGLGMVLGWLLALTVIQNPVPSPVPSIAPRSSQP